MIQSNFPSHNKPVKRVLMTSLKWIQHKLLLSLEIQNKLIKIKVFTKHCSSSSNKSQYEKRKDPQKPKWEKKNKHRDQKFHQKRRWKKHKRRKTHLKDMKKNWVSDEVEGNWVWCEMQLILSFLIWSHPSFYLIEEELKISQEKNKREENSIHNPIPNEENAKWLSFHQPTGGKLLFIWVVIFITLDKSLNILSTSFFFYNIYIYRKRKVRIDWESWFHPSNHDFIAALHYVESMCKVTWIIRK